MAATLFKTDIMKLRAALSLKSCSETLRHKVGHTAREPYRELLKKIEGRLQATIEWTESYLNKKSTSSATSNGFVPYKDSAELMEPLLLMYNSLIETGQYEIADGDLTDTIRRVTGIYY
jgi:phosphoenolpyruvate carboxylase